MPSRIFSFVFVFIPLVHCGYLSAQTIEQFKADAEKAIELVNERKIDEAKAITDKLLQQAKTDFAKDSDAAISLYNLGGAYNNASLFEEASVCLQETIAIDERVFGEDSMDVAINLNNMASLYKALGRDSEAIPLYERALKIKEEKLGPDHLDLVTFLNNLGSLYDAQNRYSEAEPLFERALKIREEKLGPDHLDVAISLNNLVLCYFAQKRYSEAEPLCKRALKIGEIALEPDHPDLATFHHNLGSLYYKQGRYLEAEPLFKLALKIREMILEPDHLDLARFHNSLALLYYKQKRYSEAEPFCERALQIYENIEDHSNTAALLNELMGFYLNEQSMQIYEYIENHPRTVTLLSKLAKFNYDQGLYARAEPLYNRVLQIYENIDKEHPDTAQSLTNLAKLHLAQGRYADAEPLYKRAVQIYENIDKEHPDTAQSLTNLAELYLAQGRYNDAEPLCKLSLQIWDNIDKDHLKTAESLYTLARIYERQGRYTDAEPLYKRALQIHDEKQGAGNHEMLRSLISLLWLYETQGRQEEAKPFYEKYEKSLTPYSYSYMSPETVHSLIRLAALHKVQENYGMAELLSKQSLRMCVKELGEDHPLTAESLNNLAVLYYIQGRDHAHGVSSKKSEYYDASFETELPYQESRFARAESYFNIAIKVFEKSRVAADLRQNCYYNRALLCKETSRFQEAVDDLKDAMNLSLEVRKNASGSDEQRAETFAGYYNLFETMVGWQYEFSQNGNENYNVAEAYNAMELSRGRGLQDLIDIQGFDILEGVPEAEAEKLRNEEQNAQTDVKSFEKQVHNNMDNTAQREKLEILLNDARKRLVDANAAIKNASPLYREFIGKDRKPVPLDDVKKKLNTDQCLALEYLIGNDASYLLVYGFQQEKPMLFPLQINEDQVESFDVEAGPLTAQKLNAIFQNEKNDGVLQLVVNPSHAEYTRQLHAKLVALWSILVPDETLRAKITSNDESLKQLLILPDGPLARLPFEMLVVNGNATEPSYLLDQKPTTLYAPSMSFYYNLSQRPIPVEKKALTVGNPDYIVTKEKPADSTPEARPGKISVQSALPLQSYRPQSIIPTRSAYIESRFGQLAPLRFSANETYSVMRSCTSFQIPVQRFDAKESTEKNVRENVKGCTFVHLACHGIAFEEYGNVFGCLALTVGNQDDPNDDGFLELREIFGLDLKTCELAILSACDTNLGATQQGEGTWSLSRGVLVAGSRRVVTSNWGVGDQITAELVSDFVKQTNPASIQDYAAALRSAQLKVKNDRLETAHPYYWASFVLVGTY